MINAAVIGGGPAGIISAMVLNKYVRSLDVYDPGQHFGGRTLTSYDKGVLLNTPLTVSSMVHGNFHSFGRYLNRKYNLNQIFVPRTTAKRYLRDLWDKQTKDRDVNLIDDSITNIIKEENSYKVCGTKGEKSYDIVVIAIGQPFADLPSSNKIKTIQAFPNDWVNNIDTSSNISIAGTSLSAVDTILSLYRLEHKGKITVISRSGNLPAVRRGIFRNDALRKTETPEQAFEYFMKLLPDLEGQGPVERFNSLCEQSEERITPWEKEVLWLVEEMDRHYSLISDEKKIELESTFNPKIMSYATAIPLLNARILVQMLKNKQIEIVAGEIKNSEDVEKITQEKCGHKPDLIINALGMASPSKSQLVKQLTDSGLVETTHRGGIRVDIDTYRVIGHDNLYALGPVTSGQIFAENFIQSTMNSAHKIDKALHSIFEPGYTHRVRNDIERINSTAL
jgi:uncharacterized NAD(P)/FAD-binding protein YdhS